MSQIDLKNADVIVEHNENIFISDLLSLEDTLILEIRENGLPEIEILIYQINKEIDLNMLIMHTMFF